MRPAVATGDEQIRRQSERDRAHEQSRDQGDPTDDLEGADGVGRDIRKRHAVTCEGGRLGRVMQEFARPEAQNRQSGRDARDAGCRMDGSGIPRPADEPRRARSRGRRTLQRMGTDVAHAPRSR